MLDEIEDVEDDGYVLDYLKQDLIKGHVQQRCELMHK